jgi:hypothetical protein
MRSQDSPEPEVGICGEHGGDRELIEWCHMIGNNCFMFPFRVPTRFGGGVVLTDRPKVAKKAVAKKLRKQERKGCEEEQEIEITQIA